MRTRRTSAIATTALLVLSSPAWAHHAEWMHDRPFVQGLSMPIHGVDHLLVAFAVGLVAARIGGRAAWGVPAAFGVFLWIGGLLNAHGVAVPLIEPAILASTLLLGAILVARRAVSTSAALAVASVLAIIQGSALIEAPRDAAAASTLAVFSLGCLLSAFVVIGLGVVAGLMLRAAARPVALRYAGAAIAAAGVVVYSVPALNDVIIRLLE